MINTQLITELTNQLQKKGWFESSQFVPKEICEVLLQQLLLHKESQNLKPAKIGLNKDLQQNIRGDLTHWIDFDQPTSQETGFALWLKDLAQAINHTTLLGIDNWELHYAFYPPSAGYDKHLDVFQTQSDRVLSFVLYLNKNWQHTDGGELVLFNENNPAQIEHKISPQFGHCALFLSDKIYHKVNFTNAERFTVTGWLKKRSQSSF